MSELLKKDITIRVISILFALALWFVVNPVTTRELTIPLSIINENSLKDKTLELKNRNFTQTVQVRIRGKEDKINKINTSDFEATLDFSKVASVKDSIIEVEGPIYKGNEKGVKIESVWPKEVSLDLERIITKTFSVEIDPPLGELKQGYKVTNVVAKPDKVDLREVESLINQVGKVRASVDVTNLNESITASKNCTVYDKNGKEIPQLSKLCNVELYVEISKEVPVTVVSKDDLSTDYVGGIKKVTPDKALLTGPGEILDKINEIKTEPVSLQNITKSTDVTAPLVLPEGVRLVKTPEQVVLNVAVEPLLEKDVTISKSDVSLINVNSQLKYTIQSEDPVIKVKGLKADLNLVNPFTVKLSADVAGLDEGKHMVAVDVYVPGNAKLLDSYKVEILVEKVPVDTGQA